MFEVPAVHRRTAGLSGEDRAVLAALIDRCAWLRGAQFNLLATLRQQRAISEQAYTGLLADGDQLDAAVADLARSYGPAPAVVEGTQVLSRQSPADVPDQAPVDSSVGIVRYG